MGKLWDISFLKEKVRGFAPLNKRAKIILAIGIAGIALIVLSDFFGGKSSGNNTKTQTSDIYMSNEQYTTALENKLYHIVENIEGVGKVSVMVTLENGVEFVYAQEEKRTSDITQDQSDGTVMTQTKKDDSEKSYILVDGEDGREALILKQLEPKVKGVVIVCQGADDLQVQERVLDAVTTALDLSSSRVCVTKLQG